MKAVEFKPPKDFTIPEGSDPSKDFDVVCSFKQLPDGSLRLTVLGTTPMPEPEERRYKMPNFHEFSKQMNQEAESRAAAATASTG
jgi:hypothetical protein